jgi:hypothetical protein
MPRDPSAHARNHTAVGTVVSGDAVGLRRVAASAEPPLEPHHCDMVVSADAIDDGSSLPRALVRSMLDCRRVGGAGLRVG